MESLSDRRLLDLLQYWTQKRTSAGLPGRRDIDPMELRALLPYLLLIEVVAGIREPAYRFRLAGTAAVDILGRDPTGAVVSEEVCGNFTGEVLAILSAAIRSRLPSAYRLPMTWFGRPGRAADVLLLPLASDGIEINMILAGIADPSPGAARIREHASALHLPPILSCPA